MNQCNTLYGNSPSMYELIVLMLSENKIITSELGTLKKMCEDSVCIYYFSPLIFSFVFKMS